MNDHQNQNLIAKLDDFEREASSSSLSDAKLQKKNELVRFGSGNLGKGVLSHRPRIGSLRRRRMRRRASSQSPFCSSRMGQEIFESEASSVPTEGESKCFCYVS